MSNKTNKEEVIALANSRNHQLQNPANFESIYKDGKSQLTFKCQTCGCIFETSLNSYKNAKKTGCPECKKLVIQKTHKGKTLSEETKAKIGDVF